MLHIDLALKLFEAFCIQRWTDLIRPYPLIEMDAACERMILVYIIGKYEEHKGKTIDWHWCIYASLFDILSKIALCDIKSPVLSMIRTNYPKEYSKLNEWVLHQYSTLIDDFELLGDFSDYLLGGNGIVSPPYIDETARELSHRVYRAAHKYASLRELEMIAPVNERQRLEHIEKELYEDLGGYLDLRGLQLLLTKQKPYDLILKIEQLRFQTRWNQTPRIPSTSVMGHCYYVAALTLLLTRQSFKGSCAKRLYNDFFSALFHDLPEAVTRDIISPVKQATEELPSIVKVIESEVMQKELVPLMEDFYVKELLYWTSNEFTNRILDGQGKAVEVSYEELGGIYDKDEYSPVDGKLVRLSDQLAAFLEAQVSINCGIKSKQLEDGSAKLLKVYGKGPPINGVMASELFTSICR